MSSPDAEDDLRARRQTARRLLQDGDAGAAAAAARLLVEASGGAGVDQLLLAGCLGDAGETDEAMEILKDVVEVDPDNHQAGLRLAGLLSQAGDDAAAAEVAARALAHGGGPAAARALGRYRTRSGDFAGAHTAYREAVAGDRSFAAAYIGDAFVLQKLERPYEGLAMAEQALRLKPGDPEALRLQALCLGASEAPEEDVEAAFAAALAASDAPAIVWLNLAEYREAIGDDDGALDALDAATDAAPDDKLKARIDKRRRELQ